MCIRDSPYIPKGVGFSYIPKGGPLGRKACSYASHLGSQVTKDFWFFGGGGLF